VTRLGLGVAVSTLAFEAGHAIPERASIARGRTHLEFRVLLTFVPAAFPALLHALEGDKVFSVPFRSRPLTLLHPGKRDKGR
jgi:hypothetical protein